MEVSTDLRVELGLADNSLGNMIVNKLLKHSGNSIEKARATIESYKQVIKAKYPNEHEELILINYMEDKEYHETNRVNFDVPAKRYEAMNSVPRYIAYMVYAPYRPSLD